MGRLGWSFPPLDTFRVIDAAAVDQRRDWVHRQRIIGCQPKQLL